MAGVPGPADDVLLVPQDRAQGRLAVAIPQLKSVHAPPNGAPDDLAHHDPDGQVEPDEQLGARDK